MNRNKILFPLSIIIVGAIIAGGIIISSKEYEQPILPDNIEVSDKIDILPISNKDHIIGNPDANVIIVEYSDLECPNCQEFHPIMERIIGEYGKRGEVAWVYRHFTVDSIHPQARGAAEASECVADVSDEKSFWSFVRLVFQGAPDSLSPENLKKIAVQIGVDDAKYEACLLLNKFDSLIDSHIADGNLIRDNDATFGTPYLIITSKNGSQIQLSGVEEYESLVEIIEALK